MDTPSTIAAAAVGAVVATATTLIVDQIQKAKSARGHNLEVTEAQNAGYQRGWFEGRESILGQFAKDARPQDIIDR